MFTMNENEIRSRSKDTNDKTQSGLSTATSSRDFGRRTLQADGLFLAVAGAIGIASDTAGYFLATGPMASLSGSPQAAGQAEAHGLAVMLGVLLIRGAALSNRRPWHVLGLSIHLLLGVVNLAFWPIFAQMGLVAAGWVTTILHAAFVSLQAACLYGARPRWR
jgi:hypothetical protein